jgi:PAS domain S-box-containing protein
MMPTGDRARLSLLAAIIHDSDDAIATKTLDGVVTSWNRGAERLFGYTAAEIVGRPITILFPPDRLGEETEFLLRLSRGEHVDHYETVRLRKDGRLIDISVTLSPCETRQGPSSAYPRSPGTSPCASVQRLCCASNSSSGASRSPASAMGSSSLTRRGRSSS